MPNGQSSSQPDYYALLGVSRNATKDELKSAYRKKAKIYHPDRLGEEGKEMMQMINEAYGVLSNPKKRRAYDRQIREGTHTRSTEGGTPTRTGQPSDLFSFFFGESGGREQEDYFMMPENDWGLLVALIKAYEAEEDGKWRVRKVESDERDWMPEEVYSVKRDGGKVYVFRVITDWRDGRDRDKKIKVKKEGSASEWDEGKEMNPHTFLGEYYFYGGGRKRLAIPYQTLNNFGKYLRAMKSLARKIARREINAEGGYDVSSELRVINDYGTYRSKNTRIEGGLLWSNDNNREWVRKVPFDYFWKRMKQAEGLVVQVEGMPKSKEGQTKPPPEGAPSGYTGGETKG